MRDSALSLLRFRLQPFGFNPAIGAPKEKKKKKKDWKRGETSQKEVFTG